MDVNELEKAITAETRGVMAVHILGNSAPMDKVMAVIEKHDLVFIEDTCESLGTTAFGRALGTYGEFGLYSFYYSHHITTGEGGAIVCRNKEDLELLRCLRAHGWTRSLSNREQIELAHPGIDPSFLFCNTGFNLKPMEIQAAMGLRQLDRLTRANAERVTNHGRIENALRAHSAWNNQLQLPEVPHGTNPAWFGFPFLLSPEFRSRRGAYSRWLNRNGIEHRPIATGNIMRHPVFRHLSMSREASSFPGAEAVHSGFFIGVHSRRLDSGVPEALADILLGYEFH
jgi:CDP-6-deoxy-D-xylo-4-hexulose-3-dehydrase